MARRRIVAGNWKLHGDRRFAGDLLDAITAEAAPVGVERIILPPMPYLGELVHGYGARGVEFGAQDVSARDPRIAHHFQDANLVRLHEKLTEQVCVEVGGPCTYTGFPMPQVHDGRDIDAADFNALVEHLIEAMEARGVPRPAQYRLIEKLARMHPDVTYR